MTADDSAPSVAQPPLAVDSPDDWAPLLETLQDTLAALCYWYERHWHDAGSLSPSQYRAAASLRAAVSSVQEAREHLA